MRSSNKALTEAFAAIAADDRWLPGASLSDFWDADMTRAVAAAYNAAGAASAKRSVPFPLTHDELIYMMRRSLGRCEITGIRFSADNFSLSRRRPFVPSIDRIDPRGLYELDNCRLVAWIVNLAISDWGEDIFWTMVKAAGKRGRYAPLADALPRTKRPNGGNNV